MSINQASVTHSSDWATNAGVSPPDSDVCTISSFKSVVADCSSPGLSDFAFFTCFGVSLSSELSSLAPSYSATGSSLMDSFYLIYTLSSSYENWSSFSSLVMRRMWLPKLLLESEAAAADACVGWSDSLLISSSGIAWEPEDCYWSWSTGFCLITAKLSAPSILLICEK